jgi:ribonuclease P protein component
MKRKYRLRHNSDFQRVRQIGKSYASPILVLAFLRNELEYSRFGFVVSKRLGKAVRRNKIKRQMREIVRLEMSHIKPGFDLVFIARVPSSKASYPEISHSISKLLKTADLLVQSSQNTELTL